MFTKYAEVEKLVHKTIDRLTDLRIRQSREFFNVKPEVALDIFKDIAATLDDAEITVYRDNVNIHLSNNDSDKAKEEPSGNTTRTKVLKKTFWEKFISAASNDTEFPKVFSIRKSTPHYSYDLSVGTTLCNIYLVANRKQLTAGIYFHGKDTFNSLLPLKDKVENIIGTQVEWNEYDKDASINIVRDFMLEDESSHADACFWLMQYSTRFNDVVRQLILNPLPVPDAISDNESEDSQEAGITVRRARFKFSMVGITVGQIISFIPTGIQVRVASDNQVEYEGRIYKLSPFVGTFMPEDKRNVSGAYQGAKFFSYKGEILDDMRKRIEQED